MRIREGGMNRLINKNRCLASFMGKDCFELKDYLTYIMIKRVRR